MPFDPSIDDDDAWWNNPGPLRITIHPQAPSNPPSNAPLIPGVGYDDWAARNGPAGGTSYPDDWFVPTSARTGTSYPDDWIYPNDWIVTPPSTATSAARPAPGPQPNALKSGIPNRPVAPPNPLAAYWSLIPVSRAGVMAWHPPIFPNSLGQFPLPAPPPPSVPSIDPSRGLLGGIAKMLAASAPAGVPPSAAANGLLGGIAKMLAAKADAPPSLLGAIARLPSAAPASTDNPSGPFSRDPSISFSGGLFPYPLGSDPNPTSPLGNGFFSTGGHAASAPTLGTPGATSTLGLPAPRSLLPPFARLQSPFARGGPALDPSSSFPASPPRLLPSFVIAPSPSHLEFRDNMNCLESGHENRRL